MSVFESLLFGLLQGITEFFPVSSSAHLKIFKWILGIDSSENLILLDLLAHLGTLLAVLIYFRKEILDLFTQNRKDLLYLFLALIPLIPCYLLLKPLREFLSEPHYLGFCLIGTSLILFAGTNRKGKEEKPGAPKTRLRDALLIGTVQSAALIPGISRSASTISCARLLGWTPSKAVRFSFLLSIPTIIGGNSLEALHLFTSGKPVDTICLSTCAAAFIASCITGLFIIRFAISFLEKGNLKPFAWYCLILGTITTVLLSFMG